LSVRPFRHSTAAAVCGGFAAERRADRRYRSTAAAAWRSAANASRVTFTAAADVEKTNTDLLSEKKKLQSVLLFAENITTGSVTYRCAVRFRYPHFPADF